MSKPITEKDFTDIMFTTRTESLCSEHDEVDETLAAHECFELAKRMAIDLVEWAANNQYSLIRTFNFAQPRKDTWCWWNYTKHEPPTETNTFTTEQLFELYQQQK